MRSAPVRERRAERDGCGCPPAALRCAHWEGRVVVLLDTKKAAELHTCLAADDWVLKSAWTLHEATETDATPCGSGDCDYPMLSGPPSGGSFDSDSLAEATAVFDARAEALRLGREGEA